MKAAVQEQTLVALQSQIARFRVFMRNKALGIERWGIDHKRAVHLALEDERHDVDGVMDAVHGELVASHFVGENIVWQRLLGNHRQG